MDLDISQVRAFVVVAERLHFGRAAAELYLTQQALSKRIGRLEDTVGQRLFVRDKRGVTLTEAGRSLLPHARYLLAAADSAAAAVIPKPRALRVDVWGHQPAPLRIVAMLADRAPELEIEVSMRGGLAASIQSLRQHEIDVAFGRVSGLTGEWPAELAHRSVRLERRVAVVNDGHPLAGAKSVRPADLRNSRLWFPATGSPVELLDFHRSFAAHFAVPLDTSGSILGIESAVAQLRDDTVRFILLGTDWSLPAKAKVSRVPLDPTPCYLWSIIWRGDDRHPLLPLLLRLVIDFGRAEGWLDYRPDHDWLSDGERHLIPLG